MTNLQPDASRAGVQRTLTLLFLVVLTALALLLGHPLERLHDAVPADTVAASTITTTVGDQQVLTSGGVDLTEAATLGGIAELCALLAVVCAVIVIVIALAARARPGRGAPASLAPPTPTWTLFTTAARVRPSLSASCVPLRL
ncbi:hypothetical protein [Rathayibacter sp. PhB151]|uniref:hypothetical protein n=1 Tax=Rathayibacter sp. PhB151 TaxID=2485189 RepID=UPI001062B5DC|nr:hypothetical protein [Rathayibacter sp. PhB151]